MVSDRNQRNAFQPIDDHSAGIEAHRQIFDGSLRALLAKTARGLRPRNRRRTHLVDPVRISGSAQRFRSIDHLVPRMALATRDFRDHHASLAFRLGECHVGGGGRERCLCVLQLVRTPACHAGARSSSPVAPTHSHRGMPIKTRKNEGESAA